MTSASAPDSYSKLIARAWSDDAYKQRLVEDPATVLAEAGVVVPDGMDVRVVENTATTTYVTIPAAPQDGEIGEVDLSQVSGGNAGNGWWLCPS